MAGRLSVICGPMFAGKSSELLRRIRRALHARRPVLLFKPWVDTRSHGISSHDGLLMEAHIVRSASEIAYLAGQAPNTLVAIDEGQFFDDGIAGVVVDLVERGHEVAVAGLDLDYQGQPFGPMPVLLALADEVVKLSAICVRCGADATRTQRLVDGQPAGPGERVLIGGAESYEPRCLRCWVSPAVAAGRPAGAASRPAGA
ncbi:thymidine kinase [Carboxydochorda subterranea]|uniref:Thymidine kinase n=1 Tax=Carboxydichorda subterranea TaxID=3109565 RepID=A0ABZ1BWN5_9FIRM|nr:thymidine kinase [Limnochorda sp. L945t]WRP16998.1 thymidine kinase [Limnochorda sp. L945t]